MIGSSKVPQPSSAAVERCDPDAVFGPPPLIQGEDAAAYHELHARISTAVRPKDFLEKIWVRDVLDLTWDTLRMRRLKSKLLTSHVAAKIRRNLETVCSETRAGNLSAQWEAGDPRAIAQVDKRLASMGYTIEEITADVFLDMIEEVERIDRMITNAEARRNAALREVDRHRSSMAEALRRASDEVVEAEFEDVPPNQIPRKEVA